MTGGVFNSSSASHSIGGDFNYNTSATFNRDAGEIVFDGSGNQNITSNAAASIDFHNMLVDKSGGILSIDGNSTVQINNQLDIQNGNRIDTRTNDAVLRLVGSTRFAPGVDGYVDGALFKDLTNTDASFEFRVGQGGVYKPIQIDPLDASYVGTITWEAQYFIGSATGFSSGENTILNLTAIETNADADEQIVEIIDTEYWRLDDGGGAGDLEEITLSLTSFNSGISQDDINDQLLQVMVWDEAGSEWDHLGGASSGTPASGSIASTVSLSFTEKIVTMGAENASVLPVELLSFSGKILNGKANIQWETASELNNDYFEVQHSLDGIQFESIGTVDGTGNSNNLVTYSFVHSSPAYGDNFYRLKQVDFDGKFELHETLRLSNDKLKKGIDVWIYPNPASKENVWLGLSSGDDHTRVRVVIRDLAGKEYFSKSFKGGLTINRKLDIQGEMVSGVYFMEVIQGENRQIQKLIVK